ncbi:hypothetical protein HAX54_003526 [Datura stramonium]|uniref:Uncharacterized protein n=1 Tax=Datura stramonium TaxID=4076 RepID=A0ABS8RTG0_DATST|nr:hypothetical protein [Datura stramonium]
MSGYFLIILGLQDDATQGASRPFTRNKHVSPKCYKMVNEAEVMEDVGVTTLLTGLKIDESGNVSNGARATNVGNINTDHAAEKDLFEHLDRVEADVKSSCDSQEDGVPEEDGSETRGDEDYIYSSKVDFDDSKDELDPEAVAGVDLSSRIKSTS